MRVYQSIIYLSITHLFVVQEVEVLFGNFRVAGSSLAPPAPVEVSLSKTPNQHITSNMLSFSRLAPCMASGGCIVKSIRRSGKVLYK